MRNLRLWGAAAAFSIAAGGLWGCGSGNGNDAPATAPAEPDQAATGTLRTLTYGDTASDALLGPFRRQNPDLDLKTATFNSVQSGAAKIAGGFETDIVQPCADEYQPLIERDLLRPIDPDGIKNWDRLAFRDDEGILRPDGLVNFVPIAAGPQGIIYNTEEIDEAPDSWADLFDPAYSGRVSIDGGTWLTPIAEAGMALGFDDPMSMTDEQVEQAKDYLIDHRDQFRSLIESDADKQNLFKAGEIVISDGGRGTAAALQEDGEPVKWVAPKEGAMAWVCGLAITSDAENVDAAYKLMNYFVSAAGQKVIAEAGLTMVNLDTISRVPKKLRYTADPRSLEGVIPEVQPDNWQTWERAWREVKSGA
ncbi:MAG: extracellular solute-binding protein [Solirubrobacterales bacterium]|nr:extracellular solute-binding protein [Solirubrobacterales bacterium]